MKLRKELTDEKLRGGFYSPDALVAICLDRIDQLTRGSRALRVLEPSAGDGAFVRGLRSSLLRSRIEQINAVELLPSEAEICRTALREQGFDDAVHVGSFLHWVSESNQVFDAAVGNPPFLRYQFVDPKDKAPIALLGQQLGVSFAGVSNLWIPIFLGALARLRNGGAFAFIIPSECLTGVSARQVRSWLSRNVLQLRIDLFPVGSFPDVLQEVVVLSGTRSAPQVEPSTLTVRQHFVNGEPQEWHHRVEADSPTWTRYLLTPGQLGAFAEAKQLEIVRSLGELARIEVSIVTGANDFFSVDVGKLKSFGLEPWAIPLLPRIRHAKGLVYTDGEQKFVQKSDAKGYLLHFAPDLPDPRRYEKPSSYLARGEEMEIHSRYKCRIRRPWYRVPHVRRGSLMLSKRSHRYPRLILNQARVYTTDTIYRGRMHLPYQGRERDLVASFHNSLTLLSAEIEGRSFGGGVLELVPSEISRLLIPLPSEFGKELEGLDRIMRMSNGHESSEALVAETDLLLKKADYGFTTRLLDELDGARSALLGRRLERTQPERATQGLAEDTNEADLTAV